MNNKCEICGGTVMINTDTGIGICDSCGNTTEIDKEIVIKYRNLISAADRKMMYNSVKYYTEAKAILEDIPFVDSAKEKIDICNKRIAEIKSKHEKDIKQGKKDDSKNSKVGVTIAAIILIVLILLILAIGFFGYKLVKGQLSPGVTVAMGVVVAVIVAAFLIGKIKGN